MAYRMIARIIEGVKENENITIECDEVTQERFNQLHQILKDMFEENYTNFECTKCEINIFDDDRLIMNYRPDKYNYENRYENSFYEELTGIQLMSVRDEKLNHYLQKYKKNTIDKNYLKPIQQTYPIEEFERENQEEIKSYEDIYSYIETILEITDFDIKYNQLNERYSLIDKQNGYLGGVDTYKNINNLENIIDRLDMYIEDTFIESVEKEIQNNNKEFETKSNYSDIVKQARSDIKNHIMSKDYEYDIEIIDFVNRIGDYKKQLENTNKINEFFQLFDKEKDTYIKKEIVKKLEDAFENHVFFEMENGKIMEVDLDNFGYKFKNKLSYTKQKEEVFEMYLDTLNKTNLSNEEIEELRYEEIVIHNNCDSILEEFQESVRYDFYDYSLLKNDLFGDEFYLTKQQCEVMGLKEEYEYEVEQEKENMLDWCKDMLGKDVKYNQATLEQKQELYFVYRDGRKDNETFQKLNTLNNWIEHDIKEKNQKEMEEKDIMN